MRLKRRQWLGVAAGTVASGLAIEAALAQEPAHRLTFEIYEDRRQEFRWRLKASNGQVIATSGQGYKAKADCRHEVEIIQKNASQARVEDTTAK